MSETTGSVTETGNPSTTTGETTTTTAADAKWYAGLSDPDLRGFAELKGWDTPDKALISYRNLEKFQGLPPERLAKIPDAADTAGWGEFNKRFGWAPPEKAEDYGFKAPDGMDGSLLGPLAERMHKLGLPADKAKGVVDGYYEVLGEALKAEEASITAANDREVVELKSEWGAEFDKLDQQAQRASAEFFKRSGLTDEHQSLMRDAMGPKAFSKLWAEIGATMGEATFVTGDKGPAMGSMTPEAAQARLNQLGQDTAWFKRFEAGGVPERQEFQKLQTILASATIR